MGTSGQLDVRTLGEQAKCFREVVIQVLLEEGKAIARGTTGVALVEGISLVCHHGEGGAMVIVKWTDTDPLASLGTELDVL